MPLVKESMRYIVYEKHRDKSVVLAYCRTGYMANIIALAHLAQHKRAGSLSVYAVRNPDYQEREIVGG